VARDITDGLKGALAPYRGTHFAAITDPVQLGVLLRAIRAYRGGPIVRAALQLAPMLFQRPGELRAAAWSEMDLEQGLWTIPPARMKREKDGKEHGDPHLVPLPKQAVDILEDLYQLTGHGRLVFPGERDHGRPISENSVRTALISLGYTSELQTWHGFTATARTLLAERLECDQLVIEAQLAHAVKVPNGRAYNRTKYLEQRRRMMQQCADYLDTLHDQRQFAQAVGSDRASMAAVFGKGIGRAVHSSNKLKMEKAGNVVPLEASPAGVPMGDILAKGLSDLVYRSPKQRKAAED
jgi:integrase